MSVSEHPRPITIRYIARNNSNKSESSPPNKSFFFTSLNPINQDQEPGTHFITLQDTSRDDAFDSANEADEEDNPPTEQSSQNHQYNPDFADNVVEEVAMECRFVREEPSLVFDPSSSDSKTACIAADQQPEAFRLTLNSSLSHLSQLSRRYHSLPFFRIRVIIGSFLIVAAFILPSFLTGLFTGIYLSMIVFLLLCVSEPMAKSNKNEEVNGEILRKLVAKRSMQEKHGKIYKGWMNILNEHYHPHTFHVNTIQTVLVRLDGNMLRISRPEKAMLKHCFYNDPTLTEPEPRMVMQNIYDLTGATIKLRPRRLARRRWFSRKYPICIKLAKNDDNSALGSSTTNTGLRDRKAARTMNVESVSQQSDETSKSPTPDQEQNTFPRSKKMAAQMSESDEETTDLTTEEEELPIRHSISDFTLGSSGRRLRAKKRQPDRYIFLFARSAREKERWFHKLRKSCYKYNKPTKTSETTVSHEDRRSTSKRCHSFDALEEIAKKMTKQYMLYSLQEFQFAKQLELLFGQMHETSTWCEEPSEGTIEMDLGLNKWSQPGPEDTVSDQFVVLVNLIATRVFYDFCRDEYWCDAVRNKIQTKLATIHLPYFIETLELSTFDLGTSIPKINKVYRPCVDEWGIWCDFEIKYSGLIKLGLETRVNLMKLKSVGESSDEQQPNSENVAGPACPYSTSILRTTPSRYSDEEMPESPETSPDEEFGAKLKEFTSRRQKTGQKILSLVDRLAHSKYFREAADLKPIRKMMEEISSTRLMLNVEVTELEGIMTCNFPPPPSDRLWYGFRQSPKMSMRAIPQVGDRSVVYSALSEWIENKLQLILEKNLVLPNMDDVVIPIMSGNQLLQGNLNG